MKIPKHPHDEFFRSYFSRPELLRSLLEFARPEALIAALDRLASTVGRVLVEHAGFVFYNYICSPPRRTSRMSSSR